MLKFIRNERGETVILIWFIALFGLAFVKNAYVEERIQTAVDAKAAAMANTVCVETVTNTPGALDEAH